MLLLRKNRTPAIGNTIVIKQETLTRINIYHNEVSHEKLRNNCVRLSYKIYISIRFVFVTESIMSDSSAQHVLNSNWEEFFLELNDSRLVESCNDG